MEGAVKFKPSCTSAALQENSRYAVVQRAPLKGKIAVHLRCSISGSVCEEGKKPKKQGEAEPDTRSSVDPIKKLLRYWRLNVSDALILPPPSPSSFQYSSCVRSLYFSCESTTRIFFRVFSPFSLSLFLFLSHFA